ncbi:MAG TPA: aminotransferase class V-fold PLP-dependent enzyme, partial [Verrucomicrobiae bacterium]|nr:aminotransferase class V-fold PLP-dependent enzyme [Verrucomicrobiae bacterium]
MSTSIPSPEVQAISPGDSGTDLIARLANDFFRELHGGIREPASTGEKSHPPASSPGLAGVYPPQANAVSPPVHPGVIPGANGSAAGNDAIGPEPVSEAGQGYAFGETRYLPVVSTKALDRHWSAASCQGAPRSSFLLDELKSGKDFYFLPRREGPAPSPSPGASTPAGENPLVPLDVWRVRQDFPALHQTVNGHPLIWLDNAATTHKPKTVIEATSWFYSQNNSNIHRGAHTLA